LKTHHQWTAPVNRKFPQRSTNKSWLVHGVQSPARRNRAAEPPHLRHFLDRDNGGQRATVLHSPPETGANIQAIFEATRFS